jgi:hypothetical protein
MRFLPLLLPLMWLIWCLYWLIQSRGVKTNVWTESPSSRLMHIVPLTIAAVWAYERRVAALIPFVF